MQRNKNSEETAKGFDTRFVAVTALKLLLISAVTALLLSGVNALTKDRIAENDVKEKSAAIALIFPDSDSSEPADVTIDGINGVWLVTSGGDLLGYAASVSPLGFGGALDMMVGVNSDGTIAGMKIVSHSETPGLGSRVDDPDYLSQYNGKSGVLSFGSGIDAITGSTISSKAVLEAANRALAAYSDIFTENDAIADGGRS